MREKFSFYIQHSFNDLKVNGRRTFFALLCIAAGVAAIVSLQTLAVMIQDTLTGNLQVNNRGDIEIQPGISFLARGGEDALEQGVADGALVVETSLFGGETTYVTSQGIETIESWFDENFPGEAKITYREAMVNPVQILFGGGTGSTITVVDSEFSATSQTPVVIDAEIYPFYSQVNSLEGKPLAELIQVPTDIVLSRETAETLEVEVGDVVQLNGASENFTVRGIVDVAQEVKSIGSDIFIAMFGFYYLDHSAMPLFGRESRTIDMVNVQLTNPDRVTEIDNRFAEAFPYFLTTTTEDLRENYEQLAGNINQLVTVMGLVSLLIGSIGIVNTMQVIVRRRTVEVAVLKTVGLQANQITMLFMVEAVIMGILGSLMGILLGWAAVFFIRGSAETLFATSLPFVLSPAPAINGFIVGVIVTTVFGLLPTLTAGQVRPGIVLRPSDAIVPRAGCLQTLFALVVIIGTLTVVASGIIGSVPIAFGAIIGAFITAGVFYLLLQLLIWLMGRFLPTFGLADLKISLRQMLAGRQRAAVTLLALVVGVFSLSLITLMADSINKLLAQTSETGFGGNVIVVVGMPQRLPQVEEILQNAEGVENYRVNRSFALEFVSLEESTGETIEPQAIRQRLAENMNSMMMGTLSSDFDETELYYTIFMNQFNSVDGRSLDQLPQHEFLEGRQLTTEDAGQQKLVIQESEYLSAAGVNAGDRVNLRFKGATEVISFEVVGISKRPDVTVNSGFESPVYMSLDSIPETQLPNTVTIAVNIADEHIPALRRAISGQQMTFMLETAMLMEFLNSLIGTFTAFPTMVAALGLIVGGIVIANSVALTTMERRREIAILKSVGLQRERVLFMILLENGLLGLIGGLIGVGIGLLGLVIMFAASGTPTSAVPIGSALLLMMLCVVVALVAAMTTAWSASGEKPLNVLRYE